MLSWILDNLVFVIATVAIVALIIVFVGCRFVWYRRLSGPGRRCSKGHSLDPSWDSWPYCEAEQRYKENTAGLGEPEPEVIEFAAFAPRSVTPNCHFVLDIWAYLPNDYGSVSNIEKELGRDVNVGRKTGVSVSRGALLTIKVDIAPLSVKEPVDTLLWIGDPANTSYIVEVPEDAALGNYPGKATIAYEGITIAKLVFLISVSPISAPNYADNSSETIFHKTAFASYASQDREEVLSRIQGMKKIAPQLDI